MTASDKKKAQIFVALLVIAGLTWSLVYRTGGVTSPANVAKKTPKTKAAKQLGDPTIHRELIQAVDAGSGVGRKNIFQYRQKPLPLAPPAPPRPNPVPQVSSAPPPPFVPPPPPAPVMKTWKYDGFSIMGSTKDGKAMASITDGNNSYQLGVGECLMGQYCVRKINEKEIEIEDVQLKLRRTFPKVPSQ
jgi:hypothetical protein